MPVKAITHALYPGMIEARQKAVTVISRSSFYAKPDPGDINLTRLTAFNDSLLNIKVRIFLSLSLFGRADTSTYVE